MLSELVKYKLTQDRLTIREAAKAANTSHTTLARIVNGNPVDIDTLVSVCNWLGIEPADALNSEALGTGDGKLSAAIASIVEMEPGLARIFRDAIAEVERGNLSPRDVQEIIDYASYRLGKGKQKPIN